MEYVHEKDAEKIASDKKKEFYGSTATENKTGIKYKIVNVSYGLNKGPKGRILGYPVSVSLTNDDENKEVLLERFEKDYVVEG